MANSTLAGFFRKIERLQEMIESLGEQIEEAIEENESVFDELPEKQQEGKKGEDSKHHRKAPGPDGNAP